MNYLNNIQIVPDFNPQLFSTPKHPLHQPLIAAKKSGVDARVVNCLKKFLSTFVESFAVSYQDGKVFLYVEKLAGPFSQLEQLLICLQELFDGVGLDLVIDVSNGQTKEISDFLKTSGLFIEVLEYRNSSEEYGIFNQILLYCPSLESLKIIAPLAKPKDLNHLDRLINLEGIYFIGCSSLNQLPRLPENLMMLGIEDCENVSDAVNIPQALEEVTIANHDESFRARLLSSFFRIDMRRAMELFEEFEIKSYEELITLIIKWDNFNLRYYGTLIFKKVLKPFDKWLTDYKLNMLQRLYVLYRKEIPVGKHLEYSLGLKDLIDGTPILPGGALGKTETFLYPTREEYAHFSGLERFLLEKGEEVDKKISSYLQAYPLFIEQKMRRKGQQNSDYLKYLYNLFYIYGPLVKKRLKPLDASALNQIGISYTPSENKEEELINSAKVRMVMLNQNKTYRHLINLDDMIKQNSIMRLLGKLNAQKMSF